MTHRIFTAALIALTFALPASAEQFAVRIDKAYGGASPALMETLKVSEIERFSDNGSHYVVLEAPNEAYVEAFILAIGRRATELNVLDANWTHPVMTDLTLSQRLGFLRAVACDFCS